MEDRTVVVYTQPSCAPCRKVEEFLTRMGVAFTVKDVSTDGEALDELVRSGFMATPVTIIGGQPLAGSDRKKLERLLQVQGIPRNDLQDNPPS